MDQDQLADIEPDFNLGIETSELASLDAINALKNG